MTWTETAIANHQLLKGKFYRITRDGKTVDHRTHNMAKWSPEENETLIRLYQGNVPVREIAKTMRRTRLFLRCKVKALVGQGVLPPRRVGWKPEGRRLT